MVGLRVDVLAQVLFIEKGNRERQKERKKEKRKKESERKDIN